MWTSCITKSTGDTLFTTGIFLIFFGLLGGTLRLWAPEGPVLVPAGSWVSAAGALCLAIALFTNKRNGATGTALVPQLSSYGLLISFLICFLSDWVARTYSFPKAPEIRGEVWLLTVLVALALWRHRETFLLRTALIFGSMILIYTFLTVSKGEFLYSDDHSVVVYRLNLLKENFPFIPFYNPLWNMGLDARDFFATGILNLFSLWAPLIYLFDVRSIYNIIIVGTLFIIGPALMYYGAKLERLREPIPTLAALLSLATSLFWYRWAFKYGSMGFVTSTLFIPLNLIFALKIIRSDVLTRTQWIIAAITFSLMLCWSLTGLIFLPAILFGCYKLPKLIKQKPFLKWMAALCFINIPWIILFLSVSNVQSFMALHEKKHDTVEAAAVEDDDVPTPAATTPQQSAQVKGSAKNVTPQIVLKHARELLNPMHSTVLIFGLFAVFGAFRRERFMALHVAWLLILGFLIAPKVPQLELDRMIIILGFVLCIPAAQLLMSVVDELRQRQLGLVLVSIPLALCIASIGAVGNVIYNRSPEKFTFTDTVYYELGKAIRDNTHGGRAVFAGFVLHELNQGHLAPLMQEAQVPLVASSLFHNVWRYTELMPVAFLREGERGFEDYFSKVNATVVIAHEKKWRTYFRNNPNRYTYLGTFGVFSVFKRLHESNYFLEGSGQVQTQTSNAVTVTLSEPNALLSFQYFPFLISNSTCTLQGETITDKLTLIRLRNCPVNTAITINAKSGFKRLW